MLKRSLLSSARPVATPLAAMLFAAVAIGSNAGHAASVTFDWQQIREQPATGTLTLTSSLLTPSDAIDAAQFTWSAAPANIWTLLGGIAFLFGTTRARRRVPR
jgi:hypothetical protein